MGQRDPREGKPPKYAPWVARLHWIGFRIALLVILAMPRWMVRRLLMTIGSIATRFVPRYVRISRENLRRAFPERFRPGRGHDADADASDPRLEQFIRMTWGHVFLSFVEGLFGPRLISTTGWQHAFDIRMTPKAREVMIAHRGRAPGLMFCTGHIGPWEMSIHPVAICGFPMTAIGRPIDSPLIDEEVTRMRSRHGNSALSRFDALMAQVRDLKSGRGLGLVIDQDPGPWARGVFVKFFGRWCKTIEAPAVLAIRYGAPMLPSFALRDGSIEPQYSVVFYDPIDTTGLDYRNPAHVQQVMQQWHWCLEDLVRRYPEQYYWLHFKWRTRPPGEPGAFKWVRDRQPGAEEKARALGYYGGNAGERFLSGWKPSAPAEPPQPPAVEPSTV
ncbi:MAG: lysophospholipid acyltransferase family protein [Planctomycetota bacterium]